MQYKTFPWNQWIDLLLNGDAASFFEGLKRAVYMSGYFKGKKASEVRKEYGDEAQDEIVQLVALNLLRGDVVKMFRARAFSDGHIAAYIMKAIRHTVTGLYDKREREKATFSPLYETATLEDRPDGGAALAAWTLADLRPSPEAELESKEAISLLNRIAAQLTPRQILILQDYKPFCGEMSGQDLAVALEVSIQTINKEVSKIKTVIRAAALESGYSLSQNGWACSDDAAAKRHFSHRNGEQDNVRAR